MDCSVQHVSRVTGFEGNMQVTDLYFHANAQVIRHHIYEYEKGVRGLVLHTVKKDFREPLVDILEKRDIDYLICPAGETNINIFFGDMQCLDVIRAIGKKSLAEYTDEEDFILGIMLGYDRLKQCRRYLERSGYGSK